MHKLYFYWLQSHVTKVKRVEGNLIFFIDIFFLLSTLTDSQMEFMQFGISDYAPEQIKKI